MFGADKEDIKALSEVFSLSAVPVFICDMAGTLIWENSAFENMLHEQEDRCAFALCAADAGQNGCITFGSSCYTLNAITLNTCRAYEINRRENLTDVFASQGIRDYLVYVFTHLRQCAVKTSAAADGIYSLLRDGGLDKADSTAQQIVSRLNEIDGGAAALIEQLANPEQLLYLLGGNGGDITVSVGNEAKKVASAAQKGDFARRHGVKISFEENKPVYAHINRNACRILIADMIKGLMDENNAPERITVRCGENDGEALVDVISEGALSSCAKQDDLFFSYICDTFCANYGGSYAKMESDNGFLCRLSFKAVGDMDGSVRVSSEVSYTDDENDVMNAIFHKEKYILQ